MTDAELIRQYVDSRSEAAFTQIVGRHLSWVRSVAERQVRDRQLAEDVTQAVFIALARQAKSLGADRPLSPWLFRVARYASCTLVRNEARRRRREREIARMTTDSTNTWLEMAPMLDELVAHLGAVDRQAILLRFYEGQTFPEMGQAMGLSEEAARKRADRAVEKLRGLFARRGVVAAPAAVAGIIAANIAQPAGAELVQATAHAAMAGAGQTAATTAATTMARAALQHLVWIKVRAAAAILLLVGLLAGAVTMVSATRAQAQPAAAPSVAASAPAPAPAAAAVTKGPASTPKGTVIAAYQAALAGDVETHLRCFQALSVQQTKVLRQYVRAAAAAGVLMDATAERFGKESRAALLGPMRMGVEPADVERAGETITDTTAEVDMGASGPGVVPLVKVGDVWLIKAQVLDRLNPDAVAQTERYVPQIERLADAIRQGRFQTLDQAKLAMAKAVGMNPAPTPVQPGQPTPLENLAKIYGLKDGEDLRRVKPPFGAERRQFADTEFAYARGSANLPTLGFRWDGKKLAWCLMSYEPASLRGGIMSVLDIPWYNVAGLDRVHWDPGDGDWIIRDGLSIDQRLAALAKIISEGTGKPLAFKHRIERRSCIVLKGETRHAPKDRRNFEVVAVTLDPLPDEELKEWIKGNRPKDSTHQFDFQGVASYLQAPFFQDRGISIAGVFYISADAKLDRTSPTYRQDLQQVLDNVAGQVGGEWSIEDRDIDVWEPVGE